MFLAMLLFDLRSDDFASDFAHCSAAGLTREQVLLQEFELPRGFYMVAHMPIKQKGRRVVHFSFRRPFSQFIHAAARW